jgi:hypothetical protein
MTDPCSWLPTMCLRYVLSHLHFLDINGDGMATFVDLMHCLNVIDLRLPSGAIVKGGAFPRPRATPRQPLKPAGAGAVPVRAPLNQRVDSYGR